MASLALAFDILARDKASSTFDKVGDSADRTGGKVGNLGSKFADFGKKAAVGLAGLGVGAVALGKGFIDAAVESQKVTAQTSAVIKSMGGVANVSADQVAALSEALAMKTGVDDEVIQSGQNVLLTFGNIQNAIGDGPKIFDRATQAALDMSVALGQDMSSASMMVGKALNDPIDGISKLSRSGIQFTDQQKEQIRTMQEAGDMAGAQAVMLGELERQFGGSAEAQATAGDKLKVVWGNIQETLGEKLLPVFESVASWLAEKLPVVIASAETLWARIDTPIANTATTIGDFVETTLEGLKVWWENNGQTVITAAETLATGVKEAFDAVIEAGGFVVEHWDQFQILAAAMAAAVVGHYVALGVAAVTSATTQAGAWVTMKLAAIASKAETAAIIALMIADWALLAGKAVFHAAVVAGAWVATQLAALRADATMVASAVIQGGAWAGLATSAETNAARIARAWLAALGPAAAVIAAAETINEATGQKANPNNLSLWERLDPRKAFDGMSFDIPFFDSGGIMPGPRGVHALAMVAGGETVLPTHRPGFEAQPSMVNHFTVGDQRVAKDIVHELGVLQLRAGSL